MPEAILAAGLRSGARSPGNWTADEKKKAEGEALIGVGYNTKTSVLTRSELYVSLGYDRNIRRVGVQDWNNNEQISDLTGGVSGYNNYYMSQNGASYTFVETAAMDLNNTGNQTVAGPITVANGDRLEQMEDLDTYELRGAMSVAAGDFDGDGNTGNGQTVYGTSASSGSVSAYATVSMN